MSVQMPRKPATGRSSQEARQVEWRQLHRGGNLSQRQIRL